MVDKASIVRMAAAVLAALKLILQPLGIEISQEVINAMVDTVAAGVVLYAAWKNNYISKKGKKQKAFLEKSGLL